MPSALTPLQQLACAIGGYNLNSKYIVTFDGANMWASKSRKQIYSTNYAKNSADDEISSTNI
jgi:hypothetical protein